MWCLSLWDTALLPVQIAVAFLVALCAAWTDLRDHRIPNALTFPALGIGLVWAFTIRGLPGLAESIAGAAMLAAPYVFIFLKHMGGAGDAKVMAAIGAWLGPVDGEIALFAVSVIGAAVAMVHLVSMYRALDATLAPADGDGDAGVAADVPDARKPVSPARRVMPFGGVILGGTCAWAIGVSLWRASRPATRMRRAVSLIETAIVLTVILMPLTMGLFEYGWLFLKSQQITNAARQGARVGARADSTSGDVQQAVLQTMTASGLEGSGYQVIIDPLNLGSLETGQTLTVTVRVSYENIGLGLPLTPTPQTLSAATAMAREGP